MEETKKMASCYLNTDKHFATIAKTAKIDTANGLTQEIIKVLNHRRNFVYRNNSLATPGRRNNVKKGQPDIVGVTKLGYFFGGEIKIGNDKQSDEQRKFQEDVICRGGIYLIFRSIEDFYRQLEIYSHSL